ncbi:hypothetical protein ACHAWF_010905 [Thalassiosira exigua]
MLRRIPPLAARTTSIRGASSRTAVRDPRKAKRAPKPSAAAVVATDEGDRRGELQRAPPGEVGRPRMAFEPSEANRQSLGLGSYALAGVGVALGVTLVSAIFGAIG